VNADLASILEYLQAIGWEEIYLPRQGVRRMATPPGETRAHLVDRADRSTSAAAAPPATVVPSSSGERAEKLRIVANEAESCARCRLAAGRRTVVFGSGNPDADLMFIGEGPGAEEDKQGLPFVGPAGQLLTKIIGAIGLLREQVYIANVVKCRPPGNRDPQPDEVAACHAFLAEQVRLVQPRVIVALGRIAAQTLLGNELPVGRLRGSWHRVFDVPLRVTYHPAALLRNEALKRPTWEDMQVVRDRLAGSG
jgi:DNA polymerase